MKSATAAVMDSVVEIITHALPHLDEIVAIWLLKCFGEELYPEVNNATISFWGNGGITPDGRKADDYEKDGILLIGVGGSRFDEHPVQGHGRKKDECAATLVAKYLGIETDPALAQILKFTLKTDLDASDGPLSLGQSVKKMHKHIHPDEPEKVMALIFQFLDAEYLAQKAFHNEAAQAYDKAEKETIEGSKGKLQLVIAKSDCTELGRYARAKGAAIIVQRRSCGQVTIHTNHRFKIRLDDLVKALRVEEQMAKGRVVTTDWTQLAAEGKVAGADEWFFHEKGQMLLNGSQTAPGVPPTKLSLEDIVSLVKIAMNQRRFAPDFYQGCIHGTCSASRQNQCPYYPWGLTRCKTVRFNARKK